MPRFLRLLSPALGALACACAARPLTPAPAPAASPAPTPSALTAATPPDATGDSRVEVVPEVAEPQPLAQAGCTFGSYEGALVSGLDFVVDGRKFASVAGRAKVESVQVSEDGARAYAIVETETVRIAANVDPRSVQVGLRAKVDAVDGWLEIRSANILRATGGQATVAIRFPNRFRPVRQRSSVSVPCSDLTLLDEGQPSSWGDVQVRAGKVAELKTRPGGEVVGHVSGPAPNSRSVSLGSGMVAAIELPDLKKLEERGEFVRVRLAGDSTAVVGWIAKSALDDKAAVAGLLGLLGHGAGLASAHLTCSRDVDLFVESGGNRIRVGTLRGNKSVAASVREEGGFNVHLLDDGLAAIFGTGNAPSERDLNVFVDRQDAAACGMSGG